MKTSDDEDIVVVGRLGSPYGVQGWLRLQSFTVPPENLLDYQPWFVQAPRGGVWSELVKPRCRPHKKGFVVQLEGITNRDMAAVVTGSLVGVQRSALPDQDAEGEHYWRDLVGCRVMNESGAELGEVDHLLETGAHDVLVLGDGEAEQVLIPYASEYVLTVDVDNRVITVAWDPSW